MGATPSKISASRGAGILGLSNFKTPVEVWLKIMEEREPGFCAANNYQFPIFEDSAVLRWGLAFENAICDLAENETAQGSESNEFPSIINREKYFENSDLDFVTCHIDGEYFGLKKLHEGKTTNIFIFKDATKWGDPGTDQIPMDYQVQCQQQLACTDYEDLTLSVLVFPKMQDDFEKLGYEISDGLITRENYGQLSPLLWATVLEQMGFFHQYQIKADPELQDKLLEAYFDFWKNNVLGCTPPEPKKYSDVRRIVRAPAGTIVAGKYIESLSAEYKAIGKEKTNIDKRKDEIKMMLTNYMEKAKKFKDQESSEKFILLNQQGKKLHQYTAKGFR